MKLQNNKTGEIGVINLKVYVYDTIETLYNEWKDIIPNEPLIKGEKFINLFKLWAKVNEDINDEGAKYKKQFVYRKDKDMLFYADDGGAESGKYGIGFYLYAAFIKLEDGKLYSYYDLVGKE